MKLTEENIGINSHFCYPELDNRLSDMKTTSKKNPTYQTKNIYAANVTIKK